MRIDSCKYHNKRLVSTVITRESLFPHRIKTRYYCNDCDKYRTRITYKLLKEGKIDKMT